MILLTFEFDKFFLPLEFQRYKRMASDFRVLFVATYNKYICEPMRMKGYEHIYYYYT